VKSLGQKLLNDRHVVVQRRLRQSAFLQQVTPELVGYLRAGVVCYRLLARLYNARLAKHSQQSFQRYRIASADSLLSVAKSQESIHDIAIQIPDGDLLLLKPPAEIGNYNDLLSDRVVPIALLNPGSCVSIKVFAQRPLSQPLQGAWESEELVCHSPRVPTRTSRLCRLITYQTPMKCGCRAKMRHSPGGGIVSIGLTRFAGVR
jgi:hypothetical protein